MARIKPKANQTAQKKAPKQERSKETMAFILKAAEVILAQRSLDESSTTDIARKAGVSVGTLYQYFPNKFSLASALLEQQIKENIRTIEEVFDRSERKEVHPDWIHQVSVEICDFYFGKRSLFKNLFVHVAQFDKILFLEKTRTMFIKRLAAILKNKSSPGAVISHPQRKAGILLPAVMGVVWANVFSSQKVIPSALITKEIETLIHGYLFGSVTLV